MAADADTNVENGNASAVDYTAYPPPPPAPREKLTADEADGLTPARAEMHKKVLEHFRSESYKLPGVKEKEEDGSSSLSGELRDEEKFWLSNDCMLRYLRATKWVSAKLAIERLEGTLKWRREYGVYELTAELVEPEAVTGKMVTFGYDTLGRPALYMIPSRQNTEDSPRQIQYTVWMLERALELTGPGVESILLMINFADRAKNPSYSAAKSVLNILQTHYPERLGAALILNVPFLIHAFFKMISPLIDPVTRNKMKFNPKPVEDGLFAADELFKDGGWGGSRDFVYEHERYWGAFVRMCDEIREAQMARWRKLGARVGCDEWDYKSDGGVVDAAEAGDGGDATEKRPASQDVAPEDVADQTPPVSQTRDQDQAPQEPLTTDQVLADGDSEVLPPPEGEAKSDIVASGTAI